MDTPIINPWHIYMISIISSFTVSMKIITLLYFITLLVGACIFYSEPKRYWCDQTIAAFSYYEKMKNLWRFFLVLFFLECLIPNKTTLTQMYISSFITPENLHMSQEVIATIMNAIYHAGK